MLLENVRINNLKNVKAYNPTISNTNLPNQKIATLDQVLERLDLVKIDIEGEELEVL